jgi:dTDP-4-dehydrorhamnose 3,5-epimerase
MKVNKTSIEGLLEIEPNVYSDVRGFFFETYHAERYKKAGISDHFVQDNQSRSSYGMLRGLHFLVENPKAQLITILRGAIFDVGVDLRPDSKTFGQWYGTKLCDSGGPRQIYMAPGFAHGFCVLSDIADVHYKISGFYDPNDEGGLIYSDSQLDIDWPISEVVLSERDSSYPTLKELTADQLPHTLRLN